MSDFLFLSIFILNLTCVNTRSFCFCRYTALFPAYRKILGISSRMNISLLKKKKITMEHAIPQKFSTTKIFHSGNLYFDLFPISIFSIFQITPFRPKTSACCLISAFQVHQWMNPSIYHFPRLFDIVTRKRPLVWPC